MLACLVNRIYLLYKLAFCWPTKYIPLHANLNYRRSLRHWKSVGSCLQWFKKIFLYVLFFLQSLSAYHIFLENEVIENLKSFDDFNKPGTNSTWWNVRVQNDLCTIEEVAKLSLPNHQVIGTVHRKAIFEGQNCLFAQRRIGHFKTSFSKEIKIASN